MVTRSRRSTPWLHRWSRIIIGAIAILGAILTAYLTITKLTNGELGCIAGAEGSSASCSGVLNSRYAEVFGLPLSLFGSLAYLAMASFALVPNFFSPESKRLKNDLENYTWLFLFLGSVAMTVFSGYLMYVLAFELKTACLYCITSAVFATSFLVLTLIGREWDDVGQLWFLGIITALITILGTLIVYNLPTDQGRTVIPAATTQPQPPLGWEITTNSGAAETALAEHLTAVGAKKYGAFWCPHCYDQKQLFGQTAFSKVNYVECDPRGKNPQPQACIDAGVNSYPTWEIAGKLYPGTQTLERLSELSGYTGPQDFRYSLK